MLFRRLGADARARLGVRGEAPTRRSFRARYRQIRYLFHAVCGSIHPVREADGDRNRGPLEAFCGALLEASFSVMRPDEREAWSGSIGLDATPVPLYSKGPSKMTGRSASDPCGGWYVREGDRREEGPGPSRIAWALEGTIATMAPEDPDAEPRHPNLAVGLALGRPGVDPGGTGARVLAGVIARGHPPGMLGADRAYTAASPGVFHLPARALGYRPVMDYRVDHLGIQANSGGAVLVEGAWCCPGIPGPLVSATFERRAGCIDAGRYDELVAAREDYVLRRKQGPDRDGYERWSCPATGGRPRLMCPLRPHSLEPRDGRTKVLSPPADPPLVCRQHAITIAPDVGARHRQVLPFGSPRWARRYAGLRNSIEGLNGFVKDGAHEALADASRRRVRGLAAQSVLVTVLLVAANVRKIRRFRELVAAGEMMKVAARARRRRTRLAEYRPASPG